MVETIVWVITAAGLSRSVHAAVVFHADVFVPEFANVTLDLDGDTQADLRIDLSSIGSEIHNDSYQAFPLSGAQIAGSGGIATSFSLGDLINLSELSFVSSPDRVLAGGFILDLFGNFVTEGWSFEHCDRDVFGNPTEPCEPQYNVDYFLILLSDGVAWVDIDGQASIESSDGLRIWWNFSCGGSSPPLETRGRTLRNLCSRFSV